MSRILWCMHIVLVLQVGTLFTTTQFRSPLSLRRGVTHYPLQDVCDTWWYTLMYPESTTECPLTIYLWKGAYYRCADKTFFNACDPNATTTKTTSLNTLWFGKNSFKVEQAFAGGMLTNPLAPGYNPFLSFSFVTPHFNYTEKGVYFGLYMDYKVGKKQKWRVGGRVSLPFKIITVGQTADCEQEEIADVIAERPVNLLSATAPVGIDYAYRLDFLSTLVRVGVPSTDSALLVEYGPGSSYNTRIAGIPVGAVTANDSSPDLPSIYLTKRDDSTLPFVTNLPNSSSKSWGKAQFQVSGGPLAADGSGINDNSYFFGVIPVNYLSNLGANRAEQSTLWVVPRIIYSVGDSSAGFPTDISPQAIAIRNAVRAILDNLAFSGDDTALGFLNKHCINLCKSERVMGLGDLETEFFFGYEDDYLFPGFDVIPPHIQSWFGNFVIGVRFPTGKTMHDARNVYFQSTGHNGHYEIKVGLEGGWKPCSFFALKIDGFYNHAIRAVEQKAAPFKGATIRNIGPSISTRVSWDYFVVHGDLNFFHPYNQDLGCTFGYELFAKRKDHVQLCPQAALDLLCTVQDLDACILEQDTNAMTHKLRGEIFHRWSYCELFAGASQIVAGKHAMQESEVHLGLAIYF